MLSPTVGRAAARAAPTNARRIRHLAERCNWAFLLAVAVTTTLGGCALTPRGTDEERQRLEAAGTPYEPPFTERALPELSDHPTWRDMLHRAFLANGELEAAYFEWKAAVERIGIASAYPNSNVELGYEYMFSSERMKTFDRMTFSAAFDPMETLQFPTKVQQAGKVALDQAREAGERFRYRKFDLQRRVLTGWTDLALLTERLRIERENLALLQLTFDTAASRVRAGAPQGDLLRAEIDLRMVDDRLKNLEAELASANAMLNGMLSRQHDAPLLAPPLGYSEVRGRPIVVDDAALIAVAADENPELVGLARQVEGRTDALELARLQWIPDISPSVAFTGGIAQAIGIAVTLPTTIAEIQGSIKEAHAMLRASEAMLRQTQSDRAASVVATLIALRNSERQAELFENQILPAAQRIQRNIAQIYGAGTSGGSFLEVVTSQRTLLEVQLTVAIARADRERRLAELEALLGVDIETVNETSPTEPEPSSVPSSSTALHGDES